MTGAIGVALCATALGAIFSSLHFALRSFNLRKIEELADKRTMRTMEPILSDIEGHVLALGALRVVCNVLMVVSLVLVFGAPSMAGLDHVDTVREFGQATMTLSIWRLGGAVLVASFLLYVFSFVIPISIADHLGERLLLSCRQIVRVAHILALPARAVRWIDVGVRRIAGAHTVTEEEEQREELLGVVSEVEREGNIDEAEREMIENVVEFSERTAQEIMTPRNEVEALPLTDDLNAIRAFIEKSGHSRIPVYQDDLDHIAGLLYAKDLIHWVGRDASTFKLRSVLRAPLFTPESKPLGELMDELRAKSVHIAIVLNEFGSTVGIVTFEDLLEEIVGEIHDEYEPIENTISNMSMDETKRIADIDAREYIADTNKLLQAIGVELPEGEDYDTVGGYVLHVLGHIPVKGEEVRGDGYLLTVLEADGMRVLRVRVEAVLTPTDESKDDKEEPVAGTTEREA